MPVAKPMPLDEWEKNALLAVDDAAGAYAAEHGADMAAYTEEQRMLLWRVALGAWQASMTEQANGVGAPF